MTAARWSARRFAAIDMYATAGTRRRRRIVTAEFILGAAVLTLIGVLLLVHGGWRNAGSTDRGGAESG